MINHVALDDKNGTLILAENGKDMVIHCSIEDFYKGRQAYVDGALIQDAFSFLNADEREFLMTGILPNEWERMFREF